ncbi:MAG: hypothetical protein ACRDRN_03945 [Sciscionella sp.]
MIETSDGVRDDGLMLAAALRHVLVILGFLVGLSAAAAVLANIAHADPGPSPNSTQATADSGSSTTWLNRATQQVGGVLRRAAHPAPSSSATPAKPGTAAPRRDPQSAPAAPRLQGHTPSTPVVALATDTLAPVTGPLIDDVLAPVAPALQPITGPVISAATPVVTPVARATGSTGAVGVLGGDTTAATPPTASHPDPMPTPKAPAAGVKLPSPPAAGPAPTSGATAPIVGSTVPVAGSTVGGLPATQPSRSMTADSWLPVPLFVPVGGGWPPNAPFTPSWPANVPQAVISSATTSGSSVAGPGAVGALQRISGLPGDAVGLRPRHRRVFDLPLWLFFPRHSHPG